MVKIEYPWSWKPLNPVEVPDRRRLHVVHVQPAAGGVEVGRIRCEPNVDVDGGEVGMRRGAGLLMAVLLRPYLPHPIVRTDDVGKRSGDLFADLHQQRADAYPDLHVKAAALPHSLSRNHALVDGNQRLAWTACLTFLGINGQWISAPEDERFDFVISVATGLEPDLDTIAKRLRAW